MLSRINAIKNNVYELEGLLELAGMRNDKIGDFLPLIQMRVDSIETLLKEFTTYYQTRLEDQEPGEDDEFDYTPEQEAEEDLPVLSIMDNPEPEEEEMKETATEPVTETISEPVAETESVVEDTVVSVTDPIIQPETEKLAVVETVVVAESIPEQKEETGAQSGVQPTGAKPVFCINDRFRFRRELFRNSDTEFNQAMTLVAQMESYDEAETYFIDELGWNPENQDVMDFLGVLEKYFA
ncbi:MAG: hypothetical protein HDS79_03265 [Bacteroidales bacterium]|nr:hypothetical protein [Bacteroidales bacterium]MDE7440574.1 hypothetical protein [Muribaculaceae bacterium]